MRKKVILIPGIFFVFIIGIFFYLLLIDRNPQSVPSALINKRVPIFTTESLTKDEMFSSTESFKNKKVLVNFFATWCKPCLEEHIYIKNLSKIEGIKIIGINYKDDSKKTIAWLKKEGNPYSDIAIDKKGRIAIDWGVYGIPETFLVNSNGIIKYRHIGAITKKIYGEIEIIINKIQ